MQRPLIAWLRRRSTGFWFGAIFSLGLACSLPALSAGFYADDYLLIAKLQSAESGSAAKRLMSLFTFAPGGAATQGLIADGTLPWWTSPELRLRFFRPLSAALIWADHALFGLHPFGYHLHSLLWWLLWLAGTGLLFRRVLPAGLGLLAFGLFAMDDAHWLTIGWIAARNAPVAMTFVVWGLLAQIRFREQGFRPGAALSFGAWVLALLAGEMAVSGLMYVVAYELVRDPRRIARSIVPRACDRPAWVTAFGARLWALLPLGILLAGYAAAYRLMAAGVRGSGAYIDPIADRGAFIAAVARRVPAQAGALIFGSPLDLWLLTPVQAVLVGVGLAAIALGVPWFLLATRALPVLERESVRWLSLGSLLSLIPTSAGLLGERSLAAGTFGAAVVVAVLLRHGWRRLSAAHGLRRLAIALGVLALAIPNLLLAAPWLVLKLTFLRANGRALEQLAATVAGATSTPARTVLLWADDPLIASYTAAVARLTHPAALPSFRVLAMAPVDLRMTRVAPDELELSCLGEPLLSSEWERLFRAPAEALSAGTVLTLNGVTIRVLQDRGGRPSRVRFRFDVPLGDRSLRFVEWRGRRLLPASLPALGEARLLFRSRPLLAAGAEESR